MEQPDSILFIYGGTGILHVDGLHESTTAILGPQENIVYNTDANQSELNGGLWPSGTHLSNIAQIPVRPNDFVYEAGWPMIPFPLDEDHQSTLALVQHAENPYLHEFQGNAFALPIQSLIPEPQQNIIYNANTNQSGLDGGSWPFGIQLPNVAQVPVHPNDFTSGAGWPIIPFPLDEDHRSALAPAQHTENPYLHEFQGSDFALPVQSPIPEPQQNVIYGGINYNEPPEEPQLPAQQVPYADQAPEAPVHLGDVAREDDRNELPQTTKCGRKCGGNFDGLHECFYRGRALVILCLGSSNCSSTFRNRNDFNRHCNTVHMRVGAAGRQLLDCPFPDCERVGENGFKRKDNLLQHQRSVHGDNIPKRPVRFNRANARLRRRGGVGPAQEGEVGQQ